MQKFSDNKLFVLKTGLISYQSGLDIQEAFRQEVEFRNHPAAILFYEHFPVISLGRHADLCHLRVDDSYFSQRNISVVRSDRGGQVTAHMPGQLIIYPVLSLARSSLTVRRWVSLLEETTITALSDYGIQASRNPEYPGVWVGEEKIAAIGIRIKRRISQHGIALNMNPDLELFRQITPCGLSGKGVTKMSHFTEEELSSDMIIESWLWAFINSLATAGYVLTAENRTLGDFPFLSFGSKFRR